MTLYYNDDKYTVTQTEIGIIPISGKMKFYVNIFENDISLKFYDDYSEHHIKWAYCEEEKCTDFIIYNKVYNKEILIQSPVRIGTGVYITLSYIYHNEAVRFIVQILQKECNCKN